MSFTPRAHGARVRRRVCVCFKGLKTNMFHFFFFVFSRSAGAGRTNDGSNRGDSHQSGTARQTHSAHYVATCQPTLGQRPGIQKERDSWGGGAELKGSVLMFFVLVPQNIKP